MVKRINQMSNQKRNLTSCLIKSANKDVKPNIEFDKGSKPDRNKITYEEEKVALVLGITSIFTVWWMFK